MTAVATSPTLRERPILFSGPMVRAILDGRKTQTRRVVVPQPLGFDHYLQPMFGTSPDGVAFGTPNLWREVGPDYPDNEDDDRRCPFGCVGDRLWVRETWAEVSWSVVYGDRKPPRKEIVYRAGPHPFDRDTPHGWSNGNRWHSPIHMPRSHSRLTLEITGVRVERVHAISRDDAIAEGPEQHDDDGVTYFGEFNKGHADPVSWYRSLWDSLNAKRGYSWESNPWVWVVAFRRADAA